MVRFGNQSCPEHYDETAVICEGSGWGDEEANVVCRSEMNTAYGLGGKAITHMHKHTRTPTYIHTHTNTHTLTNTHMHTRNFEQITH